MARDTVAVFVKPGLVTRRCIGWATAKRDGMSCLNTPFKKGDRVVRLYTKRGPSGMNGHPEYTLTAEDVKTLANQKKWADSLAAKNVMES